MTSIQPSQTMIVLKHTVSLVEPSILPPIHHQPIAPPPASVQIYRSVLLVHLSICNRPFSNAVDNMSEGFIFIICFSNSAIKCGAKHPNAFNCNTVSVSYRFFIPPRNWYQFINYIAVVMKLFGF